MWNISIGYCRRRSSFTSWREGGGHSHLLPFGKRIRSIDSQAYGTSARHDALKRNISKSDHFVADHLEAWLAVQAGRLRQKPQMLPITLQREPDAAPDDPWEAAIVEARREIEALIEQGELDHDAIIEPWIQTWAADIYRASMSQRSR